MKSCNKCGALKALSEFPKNKNYADGHRNDCRECYRAYNQTYRAENLEAARARAREWVNTHAEQARTSNANYRNSEQGLFMRDERKMMQLYGLTVQERDALFEKQGRRCACCRNDTPSGRGWHIDHDHVTGAVRGILCFKCNTGIGMLGDNVEGVCAASAYLNGSTTESIEEHW